MEQWVRFRKRPDRQFTEKREDYASPKKKDKSSFLSSHKQVLILCIAFRTLNAFSIQTYFNPDEHWQSLEVAHQLVFGYGHLTWEWKKGIRSYFHPFIFALLYKILDFLHLDTPWIMRKAPRLLQSMFSSMGDYYLYRLSYHVFGEQAAIWTIFSQLANWFMFYSSPRTLSNSLEAVLSTASLFYWPTLRTPVNQVNCVDQTAVPSRRLAIALAALACVFRPTSAVIWLYIAVFEFFETQDKKSFLFFEIIPVGSVVLLAAFLLDCLMYGSWIFVPLNFLNFNFFTTGGDYFGVHGWHWYFSMGFPTMLFSFLPFSALGIYWSRKWKIFGLILWTLGIYSLVGHKEFRFVLPVLPVALMFSGYSLASIGRHDHKRKRQVATLMRFCVAFLLATNLPMALYMGMVHQRGCEDVVNFLADEAAKGGISGVLFLTPCHATPYYATLHKNLTMRFLDCSPRERGHPIDESDLFLLDPVDFMSRTSIDFSSFSHIVLFDSEESLLRQFLELHSFRKIKSFFNAHFKVDRNLQSYLVLYAQPREDQHID